MDTPQWLTSAQCLACRGCCLFHDPLGDWAPRLTPEDIAGLEAAAPDALWRNGNERVALRPCRAAHACFFLEEASHHCRVYAARPLECRLYPFLLSREKSGFRVYAHVSCPAVTEVRGTEVWAVWTAKVREFFTRPDVAAALYRNAPCFPDYSLSPDEVEEVFTFDPGAPLWQMKPQIEASLALAPRVLSGAHFVDMFAWQDSFRFDLEEIDGAQCVFAVQPAGMFMYWPPRGKDVSPAVADACFLRMRQANRGGSLTRVENVSSRELGLFDPGVYRASLRGHEYVYAREDIAHLRGNAYKSRRGDVNACQRVYAGSVAFRPYTDKDFNACAALFDRWRHAPAKQRHQDDLYQWMLDDNRGVHRLLLAHAAHLGLVGRVAEIHGHIAAYTFGYALGADTFCVLLEIADLSVKGLPAFVFSRFCAEDALAGYRWINAMDGGAGNNLARTKLSWRPHHLEPVYTVTALNNNP